jgi:NADPH2:quinone reductase
MRAIVGRALGPLENYTIEEWDCPPPEADELQVDVHAAGVTFVDALIASGRHQVQVPLPFIPGNEVSGVVRAVGAGVQGFQQGDRVACVGVGGKYAERINVRQTAALRMPDTMPFDEAAVFRGGFGCSYHALVQGANVQPGERVLVLGAAGAVGLAAVQVAAALGARVMASASSAEKRGLALRAGAHAAIDTNAENWRAQVREWAGPEGLDVVVDPVGGAATERAFRALGLGGRHLIIGFAAGAIPSLPVNLALLKGASLVGVELSKFEKRFPQLAQANDRALLNLYTRGAIMAPPVARRFAFERFRDALALAATGASAGSIVLQVREP